MPSYIPVVFNRIHTLDSESGDHSCNDICFITGAISYTSTSSICLCAEDLQPADNNVCNCETIPSIYDPFCGSHYLPSSSIVSSRSILEPIVPYSTVVPVSLSLSSPLLDVLYTWDFDDGTQNVTVASTSVVHVYSTPGIYSVQVNVSSGLGFEKVIFDIHVYEPIGDVALHGPNVSDVAHFLDLSLSVAKGSNVYVRWSKKHADEPKWLGKWCSFYCS